jgi:hypothetical protein
MVITELLKNNLNVLKPVSIMKLFKSGVCLIPHRTRRKSPLSLEEYNNRWDLVKNFSKSVDILS